MSRSVMLISPPVYMERRPVSQPLGVASIASELRHAGYDDITVVDGCYLFKKYGRESFQRIEEEIKSKRPFVVGCGLYDQSNLETEIICAYALKNGSHVIIGGHDATARHESLAKGLYRTSQRLNPSSRVAIVRGEGEKTTKELIGALFEGKTFEGIEGVTFYDGKRTVVNPDRKLTDLDNLQPPAFDLLPPLSEYGGHFPVEESRGCVFDCSFCSIRAMYSHERLKSPERIGAEIERAKELGAKGISLLGELFLLYERRALEIADVMEESGLKWKINAHPSLINKRKGIMPVLKKKGLEMIETGIESASQSSLDVFNKHTTPRKNENAIKIIEENGIKPILDFIIFQPYMTMEDLLKNINFIRRHLSRFYGSINYPVNLSHEWMPSYGTPLFDRAKQDGLIKTREWDYKAKYQDRKVAEVKKHFDRFMRMNLEEYTRREDEAYKIFKAEHDKDKTSQMLSLLGHLPASAFTVSYECSEKGVKADRYVDSLVKTTFEAFDSGNFFISPVDICNDVLREVRKAARRKSGNRSVNQKRRNTS